MTGGDLRFLVGVLCKGQNAEVVRRVIAALTVDPPGVCQLAQSQWRLPVSILEIWPRFAEVLGPKADTPCPVATVSGALCQLAGKIQGALGQGAWSSTQAFRSPISSRRQYIQHDDATGGRQELQGRLQGGWH